MPSLRRIFESRPVEWLIGIVMWGNVLVGWAALILIPVVLLFALAMSHPRLAGLLVALYLLLCLSGCSWMPKPIKQIAAALEWPLGLFIVCELMLVLNGGFEIAVALHEVLLRHKLALGLALTIYVLLFPVISKRINLYREAKAERELATWLKRETESAIRAREET